MHAARRQSAEDILRTRIDHWPEAVTPTAQLMVRIFRFSNLILANAVRQVTAHGLGFTEFEVLVTLRSMAPPYELAPTDLYGAVLISSGGLSKVLHGLEKKKLISRGKAPGDGRRKPVRLSAKGKALAERAMAEVLRSDGELIARGLSPTDTDRLTRLLRKLLGTLEPDGAKAPGGPGQKGQSP